ncbi:hypothetical protein [Clostridium sp.]|uniref:hypothetical protein n=1 Tax=Clostridium sp. TaxID=1506 RepID=UPI003217B199
MKIKKFLIVILSVVFSIFMVACSRDSKNITNNKSEFSVVENNTVKEVCEYYLKGIDVTPRIEIPIIDGTCHYYDVQTEGNTFIDIMLDVKNLNNEAKMVDNLITARIKINSKEYTCFSVSQGAESSDLEKDASIKPLKTSMIHYLAEVPLTEATGEIEVILNINGKDFSNKFNLESIKPVSPSAENSAEKELDDEDLKSDRKEYTQQNSAEKELDDENLKSDRKEYTQQNPTEDKYYIKLKEAWQTQKDYIESINDPTVKKSVQTPESAAIMESNTLLIKYPGDAEAIDESLKRVLNGE